MSEKIPLLEPFSYVRFFQKCVAHLLGILGAWELVASFFKPANVLKDAFYAEPVAFIVLTITLVPVLLAVEMLQRSQRSVLESRRSNPLRARQLRQRQRTVVKGSRERGR